MADSTTIRLPPKFRARIHALVKQSGRSAHSFILEAVERHADYEEQMRGVVKEALAADAEIERTADEFLARENPGAAIAAAGAIRSAVENLTEHPLLGRRV